MSLSFLLILGSLLAYTYPTTCDYDNIRGYPVYAGRTDKNCVFTDHFMKSSSMMLLGSCCKPSQCSTSKDAVYGLMYNKGTFQTAKEFK
jgi:hypothetical protein